jgi:peptidoglycan hydrolase-like protein with peptidoglycan-binding domain
VAVVTLVGVGACAFEPRGDRARAERLEPADVSAAATGASASPAPGRSAAPTAPRPTTSSEPTARGSPSPTLAAPGPSAGCPQGEYQRDVEKYLAELGGFGTVRVDGAQSEADCKAIKKFQERYGIRPAAGRAGPTTRDVARRLANTDTRTCQAGGGTTFCVDLTHQTVWVMRDGRAVMRPTVVRTGMAGYATPAGTFTVNAVNLHEWSTPYEVWLPYWQHFAHGMGFHETTTYIHDGAIGSHGCVNLLPKDARRLWELGGVDTDVHLFGRRPGT